MFGLWRKHPRDAIIDALHARIVAHSRAPGLYERLGVPDTTEGRFESLTLHALLVLRRLRALPDPASDVAQDLVDSVFANLEANLRELGIGDFGVPKRMKKLARAFYDRTHVYDGLLDRRAVMPLAEEIGRRVAAEPGPLVAFAGYLLQSEAALERQNFTSLMEELAFADTVVTPGERVIA
jgi:cytochrome b pre-mRNA-processing protein 3